MAIRSITIVWCLLMVNAGWSQSLEFKKSLEGKYTYGDTEPIYLEDDDGTVDSSFSYCNYGELDLYCANDTLFFRIDVCNATYHVGSVSGHIDFDSETHGHFNYQEAGDDEGLMDCKLEFDVVGDTIKVEEIDCRAWHGARAWFGGDFVFAVKGEMSLLRDKDHVRELTETFFKHFNAFDTKSLKKMVSDDCQLESYALTEKGWISGEGDMAALYHMLEQKYPIEEKIWNIEVTTNGLFATAWMDYTFYVDEEVDHCGKNWFFWKKIDGKWQVMSLKDDVKKTGCEEYDVSGEEEQPVKTYLAKEVDHIMNSWHKAATEANAVTYFGLMADDCIYLGTDPGERWTKDEFVSFAKPYFDKGKAWAFTTNWRHVYFSDDYDYAWFEESLDTHMGECRGSGVLQRTRFGWEIKQYNLTVTVLNEQMDDFRVLTGVKK